MFRNPPICLLSGGTVSSARFQHFEITKPTLNRNRLRCKCSHSLVLREALCAPATPRSTSSASTVMGDAPATKEEKLEKELPALLVGAALDAGLTVARCSSEQVTSRASWLSM